MRKYILGGIFMLINCSAVMSLGGHVGTWQYWAVIVCTALYGYNLASD